MTSTTTKPSQPRRRNRRGEGQRLREELLAAADAIVTETGDGSALSLRSVAARIGVAATSVYLHFADIDALKAALAQRCFAEFAAARDQAAAGAADPAATLIAGCQAYVRYALDHPGQYRLMAGRESHRLGLASGLFSPDLPTLSPSISTGPTSPIDGSGSERAQPEASPSNSAFDGLVNSIQRCQQAGIASTDTDPTRLAVLLWTALHGQASLRMNRPDFPWPPLENMITELVIRLTSLRAEA